MGVSLGPTRTLLGWLLAGGGTVLLTAVLVPSRDGATPTYEAMLYLALAVCCALVGGLWPALAASVLGVLALNYWFTEPLHTLSVASRANVLTLVVFVLVSLAVAGVVDSAARRRAQATAARAEADTLAQLNRALLSGEYDVARLLDLVQATYAAEAAELVPDGHGGRVLEVRGRPLTPADRRILAAFATHLGVLSEREELARQTAAARELEAGNRTRTALLAAVSHDLRTPLAGIRAAAGTLRRSWDVLAPADRAQLLRAIEQSTTRLTVMVADLLDMSRLQTGAVEPVLATAAAEEVVERALAELPGSDRVRICRPLPALTADVALLDRVVANLLSNALRHTEGPVEVTGRTAGARAWLAVVDHGPGVPERQRSHLFEPFQRPGDTAADVGIGLGLAVVRGLVEAQGGTVTAEETPGGGLTVVVELAGAE